MASFTRALKRKLRETGPDDGNIKSRHTANAVLAQAGLAKGF